MLLKVSKVKEMLILKKLPRLRIWMTPQKDQNLKSQPIQWKLTRIRMIYLVFFVNVKVVLPRTKHTSLLISLQYRNCPLKAGPFNLCGSRSFPGQAFVVPENKCFADTTIKIMFLCSVKWERKPSQWMAFKIRRKP